MAGARGGERVFGSGSAGNCLDWEIQMWGLRCAGGALPVHAVSDCGDWGRQHALGRKDQAY
jgi:hypothetical protein